jgi:hypothetical protein
MIRHERTDRILSHHIDLHLSDPYNMHRYMYVCIAMYVRHYITCMHTADMRCISNPYRISTIPAKIF